MEFATHHMNFSSQPIAIQKWFNLKKDNQSDTADDNHKVAHCRHTVQFSELDTERVVFWRGYK